MSRKGEYSDKYGFHISKLVFECGGQSISSANHGTLTTQGIDGAQPRRYTAERTSQSPLSLTEDGSAGQSKRKLPLEPRNPLEPRYKLPEIAPAPIEPLKFIRDTLDISDIDGARKLQPRQLNKPDSSIDTSDIEGSTPKSSNRKNISPRNTQLDVRDITQCSLTAHRTNNKQNAKESDASIVPPPMIEPSVGQQKSIQGRQKHFNDLRAHGTVVMQARQAADQMLSASISPESIASGLTSLGLACKSRDRDGSGRLKKKEFEDALHQSQLGITAQQAQSLASQFCAADQSGLIEYHLILGQMFEKGTQGIKSPDNVDKNLVAPARHIARQRRIKTDVAQALNQQPKATAEQAQHVFTPQELKDAKEPPFGKKMELPHPESSCHKDCSSDASGTRCTKIKPSDETALSSTNEEQNKKIMWFSSAGNDEKSLQEMKQWRPTKDAIFSVKNLRKEPLQQQSNGAEASTNNEIMTADNSSSNINKKRADGVLSKRAQQMQSKDIELVTSLS